MSSILVLLLLLSLATVASRRGGFAALLASTLPAFVAGLVTGPRALAYLSSSMVTGLASATATGLCWLGLLLGWRASRGGLRARPLGRGVIIVVVVAALVVLAQLVAERFGLEASTWPVRIAIGLVAAAMLLPFSASDDDGATDSRGLDVVVVVALIAALGLLSGLPTIVVTLGVFAIAVLAGASALLVGGHDPNRRFPAILSAAALVTGLAWALDVHVGVVGVGVGLGLSLLDRPRQLDGMLDATRGPVALVAACLVGAMVPLSGTAALLGVAFGLIVLLVVLITSADDDPATTLLDTAIQRAASSTTGLLLFGGLLLANHGAFLSDDITGAIGVALVVIDAAAVTAVLVKRGTARRRSP